MSIVTLDYVVFSQLARFLLVIINYAKNDKSDKNDKTSKFDKNAKFDKSDKNAQIDKSAKIDTTKKFAHVRRVLVATVKFLRLPRHYTSASGNCQV